MPLFLEKIWHDGISELNALKAQAKEHERFKRICVGLAQNLHKADVRLRMGIMGSENASKVRPLNEKKAIENGATFLSETFIFSVAGGLILYESWRQRNKELSRRESIADDIRTLQYEINYLKKKLKEYNVRLDDYIPPVDYSPSVLVVGKDDMRVVEKVKQLDAKLQALDEKINPTVEAIKQTSQKIDNDVTTANKTDTP